jgi:hypothetical protein
LLVLILGLIMLYDHSAADSTLNRDRHVWFSTRCAILGLASKLPVHIGLLGVLDHGELDDDNAPACYFTRGPQFDLMPAY